MPFLIILAVLALVIGTFSLISIAIFLVYVCKSMKRLKELLATSDQTLVGSPSQDMNEEAGLAANAAPAEDFNNCKSGLQSPSPKGTDDDYEDVNNVVSATRRTATLPNGKRPTPRQPTPSEQTTKTKQSKSLRADTAHPIKGHSSNTGKTTKQLDKQHKQANKNMKTINNNNQANPGGSKTNRKPQSTFVNPNQTKEKKATSDYM